MKKWYTLNHRDLPWRKTKDPFFIWMSEIILQQTRVAQGLPYYNKFSGRFKNVSEFAAADEEELLKLWQGLGYYSRVRNMHSCAKMVAEAYGGQFPDSYRELLKLKGIGKYTGAAIASICFDEKTPTIDGNAFRFLSRVFGIKEDISDAKSFQIFYDAALKIMPDDGCGDFNQSMMELGATICTPSSPDCDTCPVSEYCFAKAMNAQANFPVKTKKVKVRQRIFDYHVLQSGDQVLIRRRDKKDIWTGLFEFYLIEEKLSSNQLVFSGEKILESKPYSHQLTHQKLQILFHVWQLDESEFGRIKKKLDMRSIDISEMGNFAVPKPIELFLKNEYLLVN